MSDTIKVTVQVSDDGTAAGTSQRVDSEMTKMAASARAFGVETQAELANVKAAYQQHYDILKSSTLTTHSEMKDISTRMAQISSAQSVAEIKKVTRAHEEAATEYGAFSNKMDSMMLRMAVKYALVAVVIGGVAMAIKDATVVSDEFAARSEEVSNSAMKTRAAFAEFLTPALIDLSYAVQGGLQFVQYFGYAWEIFATDLAAIGMKIIKVHQDIWKVTHFQMNPADAVKDIKDYFAQVDAAYDEQTQALYNKYFNNQDQVNKLKNGKDDASAQAQALKDYESAINGTLSTEQKAAQERSKLYEELRVSFNAATVKQMMDNYDFMKSEEAKRKEIEATVKAQKQAQDELDRMKSVDIVEAGTGKADSQLAAMDKNLQKLAEYYGRRITLLTETNATEAQKAKELADYKMAVDSQQAQMRIHTEQQASGWMVQIANGLFQATGQKSRELFEIQKAAGIARATIDMYTGANKALAEYPPPWGFAAAAAVVAAGMANISAITSQSFTSSGGGGGSSGGGSYTPSYTPSAPTTGPAQPPQDTLQVTMVMNGTDIFTGSNIKMMMDKAKEMAGSKRLDMSWVVR